MKPFRRVPASLPKALIVSLLSGSLLCGGSFAVSASASPSSEDPVEWIVLEPAEQEAENGGEFEVEPDGSIRVTKTGDKDVHTLSFTTDLERITAFRLEAMADDRLPKRGPGLSNGGNFVLNEVKFQTAPKLNPTRPSTVKINGAAASFSQQGWNASGMVDGAIESGWAISPKIGQTAIAHFDVRGNAGHRRGTFVKIELSYQHGQKHAIGRLRLLACDTDKVPSPAKLSHQAWGDIQKRIGDAIDNGVNFIIEKQQLDGSWLGHHDAYPTGYTALSLYTLLKSGVRSDKPVIRRGFAFLRSRRPIKTYEMACQILAFCTLGDPQDQEHVQSLVDELVSWQRPSGGYSYPAGGVDLSNTQYGALALHVAKDNGFRIALEVFQVLAAQTLKHRRGESKTFGPVGFGYHPGREPTGSMTAAGVGVLAICAKHLKRPGRDIQKGIEEGVLWLGKYFSPNSNPVPGKRHDTNWTYYFLYGLERVGGILQIGKFGAHDWYQQGANYLVSDQSGKGGWGRDNVHHTCFALLFLSRATAPVSGGGGRKESGGGRLFGKNDPKFDISLKASGDFPLTLWVDGFGESAVQDFGNGKRDSGLKVYEVVYESSLDDQFENPVELGRVDGDETRYSGWDRFAIQHRYQRPGTYWIRAVAKVAAGDEGEFESLESEPLKVPIFQAFDPVFLEYASDPHRNRLLTTQRAVQASTEDGGFKGKNLCDGFLGTSWMCRADDPTPALEIELSEALRINQLVFTHPQEQGTKARGQIRRLQLVVNGRKAYTYEIELNLDRWAKTEFTLPKTLKVRRLHFTPIEIVEGNKGNRSVGLAEIELRYTKKK